MRNIDDRQIYLERMIKPLQDKLKVLRYIPKSTKTVMDVGCADGSITIEMAKLLPDIQFLGIDLDEKFIEEAKKKSAGISNVTFERVYLRELLAKPQKYDVVIFISVLHEFYTYGEGISSVLKALADALELLNKNGMIIIRDIILFEYTKKATLGREGLITKIYKDNLTHYIRDFEDKFGKLNSIYKINHFLLKYRYTENWNREGKEHYVPVTFEQYEMIFNLLGMVVQFKESYLIPFLKNVWIEDFNFTEDELSEFKSTGILVAQKN